MRSGIGDDRDLETVVGRFADGERDTVDGHGTFVDGEIAALCHLPAVRVFKGEISASVRIFHMDASGGPVDMPLYDVPVQPSVHEHGTLDIDTVADLEQSQIGTFEGLFHGRHRIAAVLDAYDGKADAVVGNALVDLQRLCE